ncbi:MAG: cupin [Acidimicrobiaceae bacterium]|nr:cupin [Acidimicrobiaceae bacterium]
MGVRRVVTGHNAEGKAIFASDEIVEPVTLEMLPGAEWFTLWGGDEAPTFPDDGSMPEHTTYFPPLGGFRFGIFTVQPETEDSFLPENFDLEAALAEAEQKLPGMVDHLEMENIGMHTTDTVDYEFVISGEVVLELDDGAEVTLRPGDTVVQNGTRHAWRNRTNEPAVLVVVLVGAKRAE